MIHGKKSVVLVKRSDCIPHYADREIECGVARPLRMATPAELLVAIPIL